MNEVKNSGIRMRDTFSKLHRDFSSVKSSSSESGNEEEDEEKRRRKSIGLKMLMSRESSFGAVGFKSFDKHSTNMKSL